MGEFSPPEETLCADSLFGVCSTPVLPRWHVKDLGHSAKSAGGRLHLTRMHLDFERASKSEWADCATVQALCGNLSGNELTQLVREHSITVVSAR